MIRRGRMTVTGCVPGEPDPSPGGDRRAWGILRGRGPPDHGDHGQTAVEMPAPWKPQNGFHSALEISHKTRDSHIPTADYLFVSQEKDDEERDARPASRTTARQTATG